MITVTATLNNENTKVKTFNNLADADAFAHKLVKTFDEAVAVTLTETGHSWEIVRGGLVGRVYNCGFTRVLDTDNEVEAMAALNLERELGDRVDYRGFGTKDKNWEPVQAILDRTQPATN